MLTSYHVHSVFSDGERSIPELVNSAISLGLDELGFSDHYVMLPKGKVVDWSMQLGQLDEYFDAISKADEQSNGKLTIKRGVEADYNEETISGLKEKLSGYDFDYIIGSVHIVDGFCLDESKKLWEPLSQSERNEVIRSYWSSIAKMAACGVFSFAGHIDLYKKFRIQPTIDITSDITTALDAIAKSGMPVELNTAGWSKDVCEEYPSPYILSECFKRGINVLITADAHHPSHLIRDYSKAKTLLRNIGYTKLASFTKMKMDLNEL